MSSPLVRELIDAGVHFGHRCSRWNPKMGPFIYGKRNNIHIIDIRETLRGLLRAKKFVGQLVSKNEDVLFVGTKRQARDIVQKHATECGMHFVNERWLGGTLTNFRTIRSRLQRLEELEALVGSSQWETGYSKKMKSTLTRELEKIRRNLEGIRKMDRLPGALVVIDVRKEINAVREAQSLGIPTVCLIDTDSDPDFANIPIPGNDDAMRAIDLILREVADAVEIGRRSRPAPGERNERDQGGGDRGFDEDMPRRARGRRGPRPEPVGAMGPRGAVEIPGGGPGERAVEPVVQPTPVESGAAAES